MRAEETGITMEVWTDLPGVQFYTANYVEDEKKVRTALYTEEEALPALKHSISRMRSTKTISESRSCVPVRNIVQRLCINFYKG